MNWQGKSSWATFRTGRSTNLCTQVLYSLFHAEKYPKYGFSVMEIYTMGLILVICLSRLHCRLRLPPLVHLRQRSA